MANMMDEDRVSPAEVQNCLNGMSYPASKRDLINKAMNECSDSKVRSMLEKLPDKNYSGPTDVSSAMGKME